MLMNVKVTLVDGSVLNGTTMFRMVALDTGFGRQQIPLGLVSSLDFKPGALKVEFANKDVLTGRHVREFYGVTTIVGEVSLPRSKIKQMTFSRRGAGPAQTGLLLHAKLDSAEENLVRFNTRMDAKNVKIVDGPKPGTKGMLFDTSEAIAKIPLSFSPYAMQEGTVEFWAKFPNPYQAFSFGGGQPLFFNFTRQSQRVNNSFIYGFAGNDGGGKAGLIGRMPGVPVTGTHTYGTVQNVVSTGLLGDKAGDWNHYAFVWKRDGLKLPGAEGSSLVYVINGKIVSANGTLPANPNPVLETELGVALELHGENSDVTRPVVLSEFKIWNVAKIPQP